MWDSIWAVALAIGVGAAYAAFYLWVMKLAGPFND